MYWYLTVLVRVVFERIAVDVTVTVLADFVLVGVRFVATTSAVVLVLDFPGTGC